MNFSPRSPLGIGILDIAERLSGLRSRSMRRGTRGARGGGLGGGVFVLVEALRIGACQITRWCLQLWEGRHAIIERRSSRASRLCKTRACCIWTRIERQKIPRQLWYGSGWSSEEQNRQEPLASSSTLTRQGISPEGFQVTTN